MSQAKERDFSRRATARRKAGGVVPRDLGEGVCVIIPCLNERPTIGKVVADFRRVLPKARILVGDNGSEDGSADEARRAGAEVIYEPRRGKGYVVQTLLRESSPSVVLLVDGDDTYPATAAPDLLAPIRVGEADMVIGSRIMDGGAGRFRPVNLIGNMLYREVINIAFQTRLTDVLSGYRAMSRSIAESLPLFVGGFEVEVEVTIKSLERGYRLHEKPVLLGERPPGSHSKIHIVGDGLRILGTVLALVRDYKPLTFFGGLGMVMILAGVGALWILAGVPGGVEETLILACVVAFLALGGLLFTAVGLVLHTIDRRFQEMEHLMRVGRDSVRGK